MEALQTAASNLEESEPSKIVGEEGSRGHGGLEGCLSPLSLDGKVRNMIFKRAKQLKKVMEKCVGVYKVVVGADLDAVDTEPDDGISEYACVEVNGGLDMVWKAFRGAGWGVMGPCDLRQEACPEYREQFMEGVLDDVTTLAPDMAWLFPPPEPWLTQPGENPREVRRARKAEKSNVKVALDLFDLQVESGRQAVFVHPIESEMWEVPSVKRLVERWDTYVSHFDMGAYGDYTEGVLKTMKAVCTHEVLGRALSLKQVGDFPTRGPGEEECQVPENFGKVVFEAARRVKHER